ncbi:MAG: hypothetical protein NTZ80_03665 [Patescibacteria group bacterium]|nr:hypothetical protein [Patescibacteria group bacterium]
MNNPQATATPEQIEAARSTVDLKKILEDFIGYSRKIQDDNKKLTHFIIGLSVIQVLCVIIQFFCFH